jgi:surface protein
MGFSENLIMEMSFVSLFLLLFGTNNEFANADNNGVTRGRGIYYNDETYGVVRHNKEGTGVVIDTRWIKFANKGGAEFWSEYVHIREKLFIGKDEHGNKKDVAAELKRFDEAILLLFSKFELEHPSEKATAPILNANFNAFIAECLAEAPIDGECTKWASKNAFGTMPNWNTSFVTDMSGVDSYDWNNKLGFSNRVAFNGDISKWDVSSVTNMYYMFIGAFAFNQDISTWDVSEVTRMQGMFSGAASFNRDISNWDVSKVTIMKDMFYGAEAFNQPIGRWDVSRVTSMKSMFRNAYKFNNPLGGWDVSKVLNFNFMFTDATAWNEKYTQCSTINPLSSCVCAKCIPDASFHAFVSECLAIAPTDGLCATWAEVSTYGILPDWDTSLVIDMSSAFRDKTDFNGFISNWDVSKVTNMSEMFYNAAAFNRDLTKWSGLAATTRQVYIFHGATKFQAQFTCDYSEDGPANSCYCPNCIPDASFHLFVDECLAEAGAEVTGECTTWASEKLAIEGKNYSTMPNWDTILVSDMSGISRNMSGATYGAWQFQGFSNKRSFNGDISRWDTSSVTNMYAMFSYASAFNTSITSWDTSQVKSMREMFLSAKSFNQDISSWDVSQATAMMNMFFQASAFDQDIRSWPTSDVVNMEEMFLQATAWQEKFTCMNTKNGPVLSSCVYRIPSSNFHVFVDECLTLALNDGLCTTWSKVSMYGTMPNWDTSLVLNMSHAFKDRTSFNGHISKWDTSKVIDMEGMFQGASSFDRDVSKWTGLAAMTPQTNMFDGATAFNIRFSNCGNAASFCVCLKCIPNASFFTFLAECSTEAATTGVCTDWAAAKLLAGTDYGTMPNWDTLLVTDMNVYVEALDSNVGFDSSFNGDISQWDVSSVTNMYALFSWISAFNQDISSWDVSSVTNMESMFSGASSFNRDISKWAGPASMTTQNSIFSGATAFQAKFTCKDNNNGPLSSCSVTPGKSVESAVNSVSELVGQPSGTYWINLNGTPTEIYCDLETDGGGWMSFASSPATGGWFTGNTATSWLGLSYTYGTYLPSGDVGDYWRDFSAQTEVDQVLFKTGDGQYWIVLNLADLVFPQDVVFYTANDPTNGLLAMVASSGNFAGTAEENTKAYYLYRTGSATDPYINAGNAHAVGNNYMLWGETHSVGSESHHTFKNSHGGVLLFVRQAPS